MRSIEEINKELRELDDRRKELSNELYKVEKQQNKKEADAFVGKCFKEYGSSDGWEDYCILYKKTRNGYYCFKKFTWNPNGDGYIYINKFTQDHPDNVIIYLKGCREITFEEFKNAINEKIEEHIVRWKTTMTEQFNEVIV